MDEWMNDFIHPLKQLWKWVCLAPRNRNRISPSPSSSWYPVLTHVESNRQGEGQPSLPPPPPSPCFSYLSLIGPKSPVLSSLAHSQRKAISKVDPEEPFPMLFLYNLFATQEGKVISLGVWKQRPSDLRALSESPEASLRRGPGLRHEPESEKLISVNSPGDDDGTSKVKVTAFPVPQSCPFISKTLHLWGTLLNDSLLATFVPQKILGRDCARSGSHSTMISLSLLVHNDEVLPEL